MKITVLNGSPKGEQSVTMQYVGFLQKKFPQHELKIVHIVPRISPSRGIAPWMWGIKKWLL